MIVRLDKQTSVRLGATPIDVRPDGYRVYRGTATYGDVVLDYPEFGDAEFRPASEVLSPEAVASMVGVPFTIHHPDDLLDAEDEDGIRRHQVGTVLAARADLTANPPSLEVDVIVHQRSAQRAVESGEVAELSPGYRCEDERAPAGARHAGRPYQTIQRRHQYNHLSGVLSARTVLPDGRRARLDEMPLTAITYPPQENANMKIKAKPNTDLTNAQDETTATLVERTDAADPAIVLAKFSPADAEILKTLSPEGLMMLTEMGAVPAEMPPVEVKVEEPADASGAPAALTADAVNAMIADAIAKAMGGKKDSTRLGAVYGAPTGQSVTQPSLDADAIIAEARARVRLDAALVESVRKDGHPAVGYDDAIATMLAVIEVNTPAHLPRAKDDLKAGRMDALRVAYDAAEDVRRKVAVQAQADLLRPIFDASGDGQRERTDAFRLPVRGVATAT